MISCNNLLEIDLCTYNNIYITLITFQPKSIWNESLCNKQERSLQEVSSVYPGKGRTVDCDTSHVLAFFSLR